ncbi:unnamed protein product, partial [Didymodactylos carnosus]
MIDEDETYVYEIMQDDKHLIDECAKLLAESFTKFNPIDVYLKTTYDQFFSYASTLINDALNDENLSIVVRHKGTHQIQGVLLARDLYLQQHHPSTADAHFNPIIDLLGELEDHFVEEYERVHGSKLTEKSVVSLSLGATHLDCFGH